MWQELLATKEARAGVPTAQALGLCGVDLVISDDHDGLKGAVNRHLQGAPWQRCQVHLMRNVLGHTPHKLKVEVGEALKFALYSRNSQEARTG